MLSRQHCIRQVRRANVGLSTYPACICALTPSPPYRLERRSLGTNAPRTIIGSAAVVNVGNVPTIIPVRDPLRTVDRDLTKRLTKEYNLYLQNPWKLAQSVKVRLGRDLYEEAVSLVRIASKDGDTVVSWNLLVEYLFQKQRLQAAIKLFNEMKKRGQLPNAQTYTTIFKGCARSQHPKTAVSEAVRIYMTMLSSPRLPPNIIHVNAVLEACARALDIESMMSVAETIDDRARKADAVTYATLMHGLRASIDAEAAQLPHGDRSGSTPESHTENIDKVIEQAKRIWQEVIRKWKNGSLVLDESLVFAMGRILLLGGKANTNAIFELLRQTMWIPNLFEKAAPERGEPGGDPASEALAIADKKPHLIPKPTTKTLSLVLAALQGSRLSNISLQYWRLLTNEYKVTPDSNNWHSILYVLRRNHSSSQALAILNAMPPSFMTAKTFKIVFSTCLSDNVNPQVLQNATAVLEKMKATLPEPDLECLRIYLDVATTSHHQFRLWKKKGKDPVALDVAFAEQIVGALDNIWKPGAFPACRNELVAKLEAAAREGSGGEAPPRHGGPRGRGAPRDLAAEAKAYASEVVALMRKVVAAWDRVITERLLPEDRLARLRPRRDVVNGFVSSYFSALRESGGGVPPEAELDAEDAEGRAGRGKGKFPRRGRAKFSGGEEKVLIRNLLAVAKNFSPQA
ncbi:uncharacterized protein DNG_03301 [Cephalotrichum gorgonifer]|uniref:Uncharacterized protein n=1 Tax=Cephalotrichum gorgonifer TaxID=2041049 RepID=A0AAE8STI4_9PEZI|nr:uncharacterized protein DNG_03301 [Cephalotrichum gorgonifer]